MIKKLVIVLCSSISISLFSQNCNLGPDGINLWQLVYQVGACVESGNTDLSSQIGQCCSVLEKTLTALDLGFLTIIDFAQLTVIEPLVSILELCSICSGFDAVTSRLDAMNSKIDLFTSTSDVCCS